MDALGKGSSGASTRGRAEGALGGTEKVGAFRNGMDKVWRMRNSSSECGLMPARSVEAREFAGRACVRFDAG